MYLVILLFILACISRSHVLPSFHIVCILVDHFVACIMQIPHAFTSFCCIQLLVSHTCKNCNLIAFHVVHLNNMSLLVHSISCYPSFMQFNLFSLLMHWFMLACMIGHTLHYIVNMLSFWRRYWCIMASCMLCFDHIYTGIHSWLVVSQSVFCGYRSILDQ